MSTKNRKKKSDFWQCVRGLYILAVIMIHCPGGSAYGVGSDEFTIWMILRQMINFPVATFVFLSGYFVDVECKDSYKTYVRKRAGRLLCPYLIWSVFYSFLSIVKTIRSGETIEWIKVLYRFVVGKALTPLYYIVVLIQLTLLTPVLVKIIKKNGVTSKLLWLLTPVWLIFIYVFNFFDGSSPRLYETLFPAWFIFYYLGLQMKLNRSFWEGVTRKLGKGYIVIAMMIVSILEAFWLLEAGCSTGFASSQIKLSSFLYSGSFIFYLCVRNSKKSAKERGVKRVLKSVGDASYGIFYIHCFILMLVERLLHKMGMDHIWEIYFTATWAGVAIISFGMVRCGNKLLAGKKWGESWLKGVGFR